MAKVREREGKRSRDDDRGGKFRYHRRSREELKARANMGSGAYDSYIKSDYKVYKPKDGKNLVRILPPTWKDENGKHPHYAYDLWLNYGIGVDNQTYLSLSKMKGEDDPLEVARREAQREGDKKVAKALTPRKRLLMWIIDRQAEEEGPQLWPCPVGVDAAIIDLCVDDDTKEVLYIDDPTDGYDLRFFKTGQGLLTKYPPGKMKLLGPSPLHEDEDQVAEWMGHVEENPVPDCLNFFDAEHIEAAFGGEVRTADDDDDDEDEKPRHRSRSRDDDDDEDEKPARKPSRRSRDEDEDADEEDEKPARKKRAALKKDNDDEEDEDEDEKPARKPRKPSRDEDEEDEETDDDNEDEDEPEEKPKKGSIRERLAARRKGSKSEDDDEEDED